MLLPVLPPEVYIPYAKALHVEPPAIEKWKLGPLPQIYASQFGWEEMVATVAEVYNSLPPDVRQKQRSSRKTLAKPAQSISWGQSMAYQKPSAGVRTTSYGDRVTTQVEV